MNKIETWILWRNLMSTQPAARWREKCFLIIPLHFKCTIESITHEKCSLDENFSRIAQESHLITLSEASSELSFPFMFSSSISFNSFTLTAFTNKKLLLFSSLWCKLIAIDFSFALCHLKFLWWFLGKISLDLCYQGTRRNEMNGNY